MTSRGSDASPAATPFHLTDIALCHGQFWDAGESERRAGVLRTPSSACERLRQTAIFQGDEPGWRGSIMFQRDAIIHQFTSREAPSPPNKHGADIWVVRVVVVVGGGV